MGGYNIKFLIGAVAPSQFPADDVPEVAFAGRSNVGKSSLINALLGGRSVARTSQTPGKTREINFFLINDRFRFVDLPGYGYAKVPQSMRAAWRKTVERYFESRRSLRTVILLVDARRGPEEEETQLIDYCEHRGIVLDLVVTKVDKLGSNDRYKLRRHLIGDVGMRPDRLLFVSATKNIGLKELWKTVYSRIEDDGFPTLSHESESDPET